MKFLLAAALLAAAVPDLAEAATTAVNAALATGPAAAPQGDPSLCNSGHNEGPVGPRPASYTWTELWPVNAHCHTYGMGDLEFPAAMAAMTAFDKASAVNCAECEGGKIYDSWPSHFIVGGGVDAKMAGLTPGQKLSWKGNRLVGEITLVGEHPIGRFPCRQYRWVMKGAADKVVAERTGLQCRTDAGKWRPMY